MLSSASGSLLDDEELVLTLQSSKTTSVEVIHPPSSTIQPAQPAAKPEVDRPGPSPHPTRAPGTNQLQSPEQTESHMCGDIYVFTGYASQLNR